MNGINDAYSRRGRLSMDDRNLLEGTVLPTARRWLGNGFLPEAAMATLDYWGDEYQRPVTDRAESRAGTVPDDVREKIDALNLLANATAAKRMPGKAGFDPVARCAAQLKKLAQDGRSSDEAISALTRQGFTADEIKGAIALVKAQ